VRSKAATWVGLIYRTETTTINCKTKKLKSKNRYARGNSKSLGNHVVSPEEEESLQWKDLQKKVLSLEWKREWWWKTKNNKCNYVLNVITKKLLFVHSVNGDGLRTAKISLKRRYCDLTVFFKRWPHIWTTHDDYLVVFIVVQKLGGIDAVVSIIWKSKSFCMFGLKFAPQNLSF